MKTFKIFLYSLLGIGFLHFLFDKIIQDKAAPDVYFQIKEWIGIVIVILSIGVFLSLCWILIKFLIQKLK